jgi:Trk K+ transport system NAD-binding subunit/Kef-type K+ transport system membrane component KefB/mannitol/fructose-specific phosphotransferase system IIA component (Ntr-type)
MVNHTLAILSFVAVFFIVALASKQIGAFLARLQLPLITGFLLTGIVVGPYVLKIVAPADIAQLRFVDELALAYIAFTAGSELVVRQIKSRLKAIRYTTIGLVASAFLIGSTAFFLLSGTIPFADAMPPAHRAAVALLAGAILVARSPSSAIAVVNELRAKGPFTKTALGVTVIMDVVVITLFSICASIAGTILSSQRFDHRFLMILTVELSLSLALGYGLGKVLDLVLSRRWPRGFKTLIVVAAGYGVFALSETFLRFTHAHLPFEIRLEPMLVCMLAGFRTANAGPYRTELMKVLHDIGPAVYVAFFTLTGMSMRLDVLGRYWALAAALFGVRLTAIYIGAFTGGVAAGEPMRNNKISWMCYITQAGVGLGLAKEVAVEFPQWGAVFATIMIAVIVLNQIVGPPFFKWALYLAKEAHPRAEGPAAEGIRDAVIFGLEGESLALARLLQSNNWEVKIATTQVQYVQEMAADSDIEIHPIPDLSLPTLNRLGIGQADSIVAMLSDEENYEICERVYENFGTCNFIVRLNQQAYFKRFHELGALVVEPRTAMVNLLDQFVRSPSAARLLLGMEQGREIIEFELRNADLQGIAIRDLHLPLDLHILSIRRDGHMIVSVGFTRLRVGDWLTAVGSRTSLEQMMLLCGENRERALVNMVGRVTSRKIATQTLDQEVAAIIHTGDDQRRLKFERLIEASTVLDLQSAMSYDRFFNQAAHAMAARVDVSSENLYQLLMEREKESSTALRPDLAIPHIIIDGRNTFHILLARCRQGIYFSELAPEVRAAFVLAGTRDQRDYHLYVLSAIAQAVQHTHFQERWLRAKNAASLRQLAGAQKHL